MSSLIQDLRYAVRALVRLPKSSALIVIILALAIGATSAVFSIVDQTILRPPPFAHADRLIDAHSLNARRGSGGNVLSPAKIAGWQAQPAVFERFEAYAPRQFDVTGAAEPERISGLIISNGLLSMLEVSPRLGRGFVSGEGRPGGVRVALISDAVWRRRFGATADVLGQQIVLNDESHTIVGVMPRRFRLRHDEESVWLPIDITATAADTTTSGFNGLGRLRPGLDAISAQQEADRIADHLQATSPIPRSWYLGVRRKLIAQVSPTTKTALFVLLGAVGFVLLTACANVANLLLTNTLRRSREMAIRSALGASRARLIRQVVFEGCLLATAAGALGILLARWGLDALLSLAPERLTSMSTTPVEIDERVMLVTVMLALMTGLLFATIPATRGSRTNLTLALHGVAGLGGERASFGRIPSGLVIAEVAFSLILLVGAALMMRTLMNLEALDPGVDPHNVISMRLDLPTDRYPTVESRAAFFEELSRRLMSLESIEDVAGTYGVPSGGITFGTMIAEGRARAKEEVVIPSNTVTPGFFRLLRIPIIAGRDFQPDEAEHSVILSRDMARRLWPDGSAVGRRLRIGENGPWWTVVGVAGNIDTRQEHEATALQIYHSFATRSTKVPPKPTPGRRSYNGRVLLVRTDNPVTMVPIIKSQVWSLDKSQTVEEVRLVTDLYAAAFDRQRFVLWLMTAFAFVAVAMTSVGLFGVLSQAVVQRRREIGIRMALGASADSIFKLIVFRGLVLTIAGLAIGLAGAFALSQALTGLLFGVGHHDPMSFVLVAALFILIASAACWLPARAAMRVQPASTLRAE